MSPLTRRTFLGALAAIPASAFMRPTKCFGVDLASGPDTTAFWQLVLPPRSYVPPCIPIIFGTISDELMPAPPYLRAHDPDKAHPFVRLEWVGPSRRST